MMAQSPQQEQAERLISELKALPIIKSVLEELKNGLPDCFAFHSVTHTQDVMHQAVLFSVLDHRSRREIELLAVAAAYHDVGFLEKKDLHEEISARYVEIAMRSDGSFTEEEIAQVKTMILDTKLISVDSGFEQRASTDLSRYLLDADLSNFGREDFFERLEANRIELGAGEAEFRRRTLKLMKAHTWLTEAARTLRQGKKEENMHKLAALVESDSNASG